jgi:hypothetical protein
MESLEFAMGSTGGRSFLKFFLFVIFQKIERARILSQFFAFLLVLIKRDVSL